MELLDTLLMTEMEVEHCRCCLGSNFDFFQFQPYYDNVVCILGLLWWLSGKESTCQFRRYIFDPWVRKIPLQKEMAIHSSVLTWEIPWTEESGRLQ